MPRTDLQQIFLESVSEVLETMFFTSVVDEESPADESPLISATLTFHGKPSGRFGVQMPMATGRIITANFLGADESDISDGQIADVVCELCNMFCGSVLSRIEAGARFELLHPEIAAPNAWQELPNAFGCTIGIESGSVTLWIAPDQEESALVA